MRRISLSDPWVSLLVVVLLSIAVFVFARRSSSDSRKRFAMLHDLSDLATLQSEFHQRHGYYAAHIGAARGDRTVTITDTLGAVLVITHADSVGWTAVANNALISSGPRACYVYGGGEVPHDPTLSRAGEPKCW